MNDSLNTLTRGAAPFHQSFEFSGQVAPGSLHAESYASDPVATSFLLERLAGTRSPILEHAAIPADWVFYLLLGGLLLLAMVKYQYPKRFGLLFSSAVSRSSAHQVMRENGVGGSPSFLYFLAIFLISGITLIHQVFMHFSGPVAHPWEALPIYLQILGAYLAFVVLKLIIVKSGGFIFRNPETAREYIQNIIIFNIIGGVALLPLILMIHYSHRSIFIFVASGVIAILVVTKFIRGFLIGLADQKFSLFHLFLYLCTLEILPVLVAAKFLDKYFFS